jgi:hypothetical protein
VIRRADRLCFRVSALLIPFRFRGACIREGSARGTGTGARSMRKSTDSTLLLTHIAHGSSSCVVRSISPVVFGSPSETPRSRAQHATEYRGFTTRKIAIANTNEHNSAATAYRYRVTIINHNIQSSRTWKPERVAARHPRLVQWLSGVRGHRNRNSEGLYRAQLHEVRPSMLEAG